jgi:hypothetical protein
MQKDEGAPASFAVTLADVASDARWAAHEALHDPLAPLMADVERALRTLGPAVFRRCDAAAYRSSESAMRDESTGAIRVDLRY